MLTFSCKYTTLKVNDDESFFYNSDLTYCLLIFGIGGGREITALLRRTLWICLRLIVLYGFIKETHHQL
jgi:hypothetical protein